MAYDPSNPLGLGFNPKDAFPTDYQGYYNGGGYNTDAIGTGPTGNYMAVGMFTQMFATIAGTISQSSAIQMQSDYQRRQLNFNSQIADLQASAVVEDGNRAADKVLTAGNQAVGEERASAGAQGIEVNSGSSMDIQTTSKTMSLLDALTIRNNAARQAFGYKVQSVSDRGQAEFGSIAGKAESNSTLLTGGLNALSQGEQGYYYGQGGTISDATRKGKY